MVKRKTREAGYNLVILAVAVTVLNIMVAVALPAWAKIIQREKEEELIFRGLQYSRAIYLWCLDHNNELPRKPTDLLKNDPRYLRKLWKNPMTEDGAWLIIPGPPGPGGCQQGSSPVNQQLNQQLNQQNQQRQQPGRPVPGQPPKLVRWVPPDDPDDLDFGPPLPPILGLVSPEGEESVKTFWTFENEIQEWKFTVELGNGHQDLSHLNLLPGPNGQFPPLNYGSFWRPYPQLGDGGPAPTLKLPQFQQQGAGGQPGGQAPGGRPPGGGQPGGGQPGGGQPGGRQN